jgi:hypothetical protein
MITFAKAFASQFTSLLDEVVWQLTAIQRSKAVSRRIRMAAMT